MRERLPSRSLSEPPPRRHARGAIYIYCAECGREIWDDEEDFWLLCSFGALCADCVGRCKVFGERECC